MEDNRVESEDEEVARRVAALDAEGVVAMRVARQEGAEEGHLVADKYLRDLLVRLGLKKTAKAYWEVPRWYA